MVLFYLARKVPSRFNGHSLSVCSYWLPGNSVLCIDCVPKVRGVFVKPTEVGRSNLILHQYRA